MELNTAAWNRLLVIFSLVFTSLDAHAQTWVDTAGQPALTRSSATTTVLASGDVLLAGGRDASGAATTSCEIYRAQTDSWESGPALLTARSGHTATLLADGSVLVTGGSDAAGISLKSVELLSPTGSSMLPGGSWTAGPDMRLARDSHTATLIAVTAGSTQSPPSALGVMVCGGDRSFYNSSGILKHNTQRRAEFLLFQTGTWIEIQRMIKRRAFHTATSLPNGDVLVVGGSTLAGMSPATWERFSVQTASWNDVTPTNLLQTTARDLHTATFLPAANSPTGSAGVAIMGVPNPGVATAEAGVMFDYLTNTTTAFGIFNYRRSHAAARLPNGNLMVSGGSDYTPAVPTPTDTHQILRLNALNFWEWSFPTAGMSQTRANHAMVYLPTRNELLVVGGFDSNLQVITHSERYIP